MKAKDWIWLGFSLSVQISSEFLGNNKVRTKIIQTENKIAQNSSNNAWNNFSSIFYIETILKINGGKAKYKKVLAATMKWALRLEELKAG